MKFVDRFSAFRAKHALTLGAVSKNTGIDVKTLLKYESGQELPDEEVQEKIFSCAMKDCAGTIAPKPDYTMQHAWESYAAELNVEYR